MANITIRQAIKKAAESSKRYTDGVAATRLPLSGGTLTGALTLGGALYGNGLTTGNKQLVSHNTTSVYVGNPATALFLESSGNPQVYIGSAFYTLYHTGNKPTPADIGAAKADHGTHLTLGTGAGNAFRGDYGNTAYTHSQTAHAPANAQKNSEITKEEIEARLTGVISSHTHDYAPSSHNHNTFTAINGSSWTSAARNITEECKFEFGSQIVRDATGLFPTSNNANTIISFNRHGGNYASQLGFSSNGKIYYRSRNGSEITDSITWDELAFANHTHDNYLPLAGGTISSNLTVNGNLTVNSKITTKDLVVAGIVKDTRITTGNQQIFDAGASEIWLGNPNTDLVLESKTNPKINVGSVTNYALYHEGNKPVLSSITYIDSRAKDTTPHEMPAGLSVHLKSNNVDGLSDGGGQGYHSSLMIKAWNDHSGGPWAQMAVTGNQNLWFRASTSGDEWGSWRKVSVDGHLHDDRYYFKSEVDQRATLLQNAIDSHTHEISEVGIEQISDAEMMALINEVFDD